MSRMLTLLSARVDLCCVLWPVLDLHFNKITIEIFNSTHIHTYVCTDIVPIGLIVI